MAAETLKSAFRVEKLTLWVLALLQSCFAYFAPAKPVVLLVGFLVACDFLTGVSAVMKTEGWAGVKSRRAFDSIPKLIVYTIVVLLAHVIEEQLLPDFPCTKMIAGMVAVVELKSIDENVKKVVGKSLLQALAGMLKNSKR